VMIQVEVFCVVMPCNSVAASISKRMEAAKSFEKLVY